MATADYTRDHISETAGAIMAAPELRKPTVEEQNNIWDAIHKDNADKLQLILKENINVNAPLDSLRGYELLRDDLTPLHWAALYDSINCASLVINNFKCNLNVTDQRGCTPLQMAIEEDSHEVVNLLVVEYKQQISHLSQWEQDKVAELIKQYKSQHPEINIIDKLDQDVLQNIKDAKEKGLVIKVRHSKVLFCGSSGIGKTNFINLLLQKQFEKSHKPTGVSESHQLLAKPFQVAFVVPESQCKGTECKLEYMDYETQIEWLRWLLSGNYHLSQGAPFDKHDQPDSNSVSNDQSQQISSVEKEIACNNDIPRSNPPDVWNILTFLDTGGQPGFINMLPAVNSSAMITFIMLSMEDGVSNLTNEVTVCGDGPKYLLDYNYLDLIKMLFSMRKTREFQSFEQLLADKNSRGNRNCYLSLVGTKSDLCEDSITVAEKIYEELKPIIDQTVCRSSLIGVDGKFFVPVSNCKAGTDDEDPVAAKFRNCIYEHLIQRDIYDIPIAWLILELEIQNRTKEVNFIHFDEVSKICKEQYLITNEKDIREALKFFHHVGIFLYYGSDDPDMKHTADIVITNYQWIFKNLTEMVKAAKSDDQVTEDFRINGRLSVQVMDYINSKLEENVSKKYFLKLLEKLAIISPTKRACTQEEYFMPCVLSRFSFGASNEQRLLTNYGNQDKGEPLLMQLVYEECDGEPVYYDDHSYMLPLGVFCCLINLLLMKNNHSRNPRFIVQWSESDKACVFNNLITLYDSIEKYYVVLIDRLMYLEVQIRQYEGCKVSESVYPKINFEITSTLKNVCDKLKLNNSDICVGFQCSENGKLYWIKNKYDQTMYSRSNKPKQLKESQKVWFSGQPVTAASQQSISKYASQQSPVTVTRQQAKSIGGHPIKDTKLLHKYVIPRISANWQTVAAYLNYSIADKDLIDATHKGDPRKCCIGLLEDWISSDKGVTPKTWERFVGVLSEISSLAMVTKEINQCLHQEGILEDQRPSQQPQQMTSNPPVPATVPQQPHPTGKKSLDDIETDFKEMINNVQKAFIDGNIDLNDVLRKLNNSFATKNKEIPLFEKNLLKDVISIKTLFKVLGYFWNLYDHDMLAFLIDTAECEKANRIYSEFCASSDLSTFDLLNYYCDKEISVLPGYSILKITLEKKECTSKTMEKIKSITVDCYGLEKYAIVLKKVTKGSIEIEFLTSDLVLVYFETYTISMNLKELLKHVEVIRFDGIEIKKNSREKNTSCASSVTSNAAGLKGNEVQKEGLKYTLDDLIELTRNNIDEIDKRVLDSDKDKDIINGVELLIMVVNSSEYYAAMYYFSKSKVSKVTNNADGTIYYVGMWDKITTALVKQHKNGSDESKDLTEMSIAFFQNLKVIVSLGVCGTTKKLGQVIVSSIIYGCNNLKITDEIINQGESDEPRKRILNCLKDNFERWSFLCTKEGYSQYKSNAEFKPMLSGTHLIASGDFRDKLIQGVNKEAIGVEMEGLGVLLGLKKVKKRDEIEFIIVKAGCDYADESKSKEWQPVAAMAAADFLYEQFKKCIDGQLFNLKEPQAGESSHSTAPQQS